MKIERDATGVPITSLPLPTGKRNTMKASKSKRRMHERDGCIDAGLMSLWSAANSLSQRRGMDFSLIIPKVWVERFAAASKQGGREQSHLTGCINQLGLESQLPHEIVNLLFTITD